MWEYALGGIPTHHLEECFRRAVRANDGKFMVLATQINQQYTDMLPELQRAAQEHGREQEYLLKSGHGSWDYVSLQDFRARHNLPDTWVWGQAYPPESDLYNKALPPLKDAVVRCARCRDAGVLKEQRGFRYPAIMPCPECGGN